MSYGLPRSVDPFHEDPLPRAHYYPSPLHKVKDTRKNHMSPDRLQREASDDPRSNHGNKAISPEEDAFLRGSHKYTRSYKLPTAVDAERNVGTDDISPKFDESWPESERPSSLGLPEADISDSPMMEHLKKSNKSRGSISTIFSSQGESSSPLSHIGAVKGIIDFGQHSKSKINVEHDLGRSKINQQGSKGIVKNQESTLSKYIERFRHGVPLSKDERLKQQPSNAKDFWWLGSTHSSPSTPPSSSTPKEGVEPGKGGKDAGKSQSRIDKSRHMQNPHKPELTKHALNAASLASHSSVPINPWGRYVDEESRLLQDKADQLLERTESSIHSSEPVVSTDGLGTSTADVSSFSEEAYRPSFLSQDQKVSGYPPVKKPARREDDILYQWRLKRRIEEAKDPQKNRAFSGYRPIYDRPSAVETRSTQPPGNEISNVDKSQVRDPSIDSKLAEFRHRLHGGNLPGGSTISSSQPKFTPAPERPKTVTPSVIPSIPLASPYHGEGSLSQISPTVKEQDLPHTEGVPPHYHASCDVIPCTCKFTEADIVKTKNKENYAPGTDCRIPAKEISRVRVCDKCAKVLEDVDRTSGEETPGKMDAKVLSKLFPKSAVSEYDSSFEELKSQHMQSLKSDDLSREHSKLSGMSDENSEIRKRTEEILIPERDVSQKPIRSDHDDRNTKKKHEKAGYVEDNPRSRSGSRSRSNRQVKGDRDTESAASLTEISDLDENENQKPRKGEGRHKNRDPKHLRPMDRDTEVTDVTDATRDTGAGSDSAESSSRLKLKGHREHTKDTMDANSFEVSDESMRAKHSIRKSSKTNVGNIHRDPESKHSKKQTRDAKLRVKTLPAPRDHSSPKRLVSAVIGQAVKEHLLSDSLSMTESESSLRASLDVDSAISKNQPMKCTGDLAGIRNAQRDIRGNTVYDETTAKAAAQRRNDPQKDPVEIQIGTEVVCLSDGEDFPDDDLLRDLRNRRRRFLERLAQIDGRLESMDLSSTR